MEFSLRRAPSTANLNCFHLATMDRFLCILLVIVMSSVLVAGRMHKDHKDNIEKVKRYFAKKARMHRPGASWEAGENELTERDPEDLKSLCGTVALTRKQARSSYHPPPPYADYDSKKRIAVDPEFDASVKWPQCPSIKQARDQGACGSCWAFAGAEAISDRYCIASGSTKTKIFSPQDMVVCSGGNKVNYCATGNLARAPYTMMVSSGVVSDTCMPYTSGTFAASAATSTSQCTRTCTNTTSGLVYASDKSYGTSWYEMGNYYTSNTGGAAAGLNESAVRQIQYELMTRGPVTIQIQVYQDFYTYQSGVYQHVTGGLVGNHAMKLIGWGTENGTDYWLIMNSWGSSWGMNGSIKIVRGTNHLGIENYVVTGTVDPNLVAPLSNLTCNLDGCQGRQAYAIASADTCSTGYCACNYYVGVWNATKNGWDWALSPRVVNCDDGKAFDASGSVLSCVNTTLVPACSVTAETTTTTATTTSTTTRSTTTTAATPSTTTRPTSAAPTTTTSSTTKPTTISTTTTTTPTTTRPTSTTPATTTSTTTKPTTTSTTTTTTPTTTRPTSTTPATTTSTTTKPTTTSTTTTTTLTTTRPASTTPATTTKTTATPTTTKPTPTSTTGQTTTTTKPTTTTVATTVQTTTIATTTKPTTTTASTTRAATTKSPFQTCYDSCTASCVNSCAVG